MRVGVIVPGFSANAADWCIPALRGLVGALAGRDEVRVLSLRYPGRAGRYPLFGAEVIALGGGERRGLGSAALWRDAFRALATEHRRRPFDVLHAFWATESGAVAALAGRVLGVPTVVSLAGGEVVALPEVGYGDQLRPIERVKVSLTLRLAGVVTAGSRYLLDLARPWLQHRPSATLRLAPLGVDTRRFSPSARLARDRGASEVSPRLIQVASLIPVKDQATLLRALAAGPESGDGERHAVRSRLALDLVGEGPLRPRLQALADDLGLGARVRFRGALPHDQLADVYRSSRGFVLSSRHEAQCLAVLEAAACGLPVVGTAVGVVPELAPEAAVAVPVGKVAALAHGIAEIGADPHVRQRMAEAARHVVATDYSLERSVERFREVYASLGRDRRP